jgi:hypothetical protein
MRVTQTKRKCPHCGVLVTPQEIDRQTTERQHSFETTFMDMFWPDSLDASMPVWSLEIATHKQYYRFLRQNDQFPL